MPLPNKNEKESKDDFVSRCMSNSKMNEEYPDASQRYAICMRQSKASVMEIAEASFEFDNYGFTEELTEDNFIVVASEDYEDCEDEDEEELDLSISKPGLWENIRKKKEREGKNYKPAKRGDKDRPDPEAYKEAQSAEYQGRKVTLNKPFRTPKGPKKFAVYTKNGSGNVVIVRFGDPDSKIKKNIPERRKSFRARHNCDNPGPRWKPRFWACRSW